MTAGARSGGISSISGLFYTGCGGLLLVGIGIVGFQVFDWLKHGVWAGYTALHLAVWAGGEAASWAEYPRTWIGIHKMLAWLPLWALSWAVAFLLAAVGVAQEDH